MRNVVLPDGEKVPQLGQGTWYMGERAERRKAEADAIRLGVELGMTLIDTAEMYADGGAEVMLSEALKGIRDKCFVVSKVYPHNASFKGVRAAAERSLKRMNLDVIDLYLLHWRGGVPFEETVRGFQALQEDGLIRHWGVSNLDTDDMEELMDAEGGDGCQVDQILYNPSRRGPEFDLLPFLQDAAIPAMAYSPIEQGRLPKTGALADIGKKHGVGPFQIALAWVMRDPNIIAIPKMSNPEHVKANRAAADVTLDADDLAALDKAFPPPTRKRGLEML